MRGCTFAFVVSVGLFVGGAQAQSLGANSTPTTTHQNSPRRARSTRIERPELRAFRKLDSAEFDRDTSHANDADFGTLEKRIRDLSTKVDELRGLLQREKVAAEATHFTPRPFRALLLKERQTSSGPTTYGQALEMMVQSRTRAVSAAFDDDARRSRLAMDPERAERARLLEPIYRWVDAQGTPSERIQGALSAFVYLSLLEMRAKIEVAEPLPALYKVLRDFHVDRASLAQHLRKRFLADEPITGRDLPVVLRAVASTYPDLRSVREFLSWVATSVTADLWQEWETESAVAYRADPESQFQAAAENAVTDDGDVLKLQIDLQRLSVEAKALRDRQRAPEVTPGDWQGRLLHAERELDRLLQAADGEREAVTTLARRLPIAPAKVQLAQPTVDPEAIERPADELASDGLATQH